MYTHVYRYFSLIRPFFSVLFFLNFCCLRAEIGAVQVAYIIKPVGLNYIEERR